MRSYGVADGVNNVFMFTLFDETTLQTQTTLTFAAGDVQISKNGGTPANATNNPVLVSGNGTWKLTLELAEIQTQWVHVTIKDQTNPKTWFDYEFVVELGGNTNALYTV